MTASTSEIRPTSDPAVSRRWSMERSGIIHGGQDLPVFDRTKRLHNARVNRSRVRSARSPKSELIRIYGGRYQMTLTEYRTRGVNSFAAHGITYIRTGEVDAMGCAIFIRKPDDA